MEEFNALQFDCCFASSLYHYFHAHPLQLLRAGANIEAAETERKRTPLHFAVLRSNVDAVRALVGAGANKEARDADGRTALSLACIIRSDPHIALHLIKARAHALAGDSQGVTPLHSAVRSGWGVVVRAMVVSAGVRPTIGTGHLLHDAVRSRSEEVVAALVSGGWESELVLPQLMISRERTAVAAELSSTGRNAGGYDAGERMEPGGKDADGKGDETEGGGDDKEAFSPLMLAADSGRLEVVRALLKGAKKGFPDQADARGYTALHLATMRGSASIAEVLLDEGGANRDAANEDGDTALHIAIATRRTNVGEVLVRRGALVNLANRRGHTALHFAAAVGLAEFAKELLSRGADVGAVDKPTMSVGVGVGIFHASSAASKSKSAAVEEKGKTTVVAAVAKEFEVLEAMEGDGVGVTKAESPSPSPSPLRGGTIARTVYHRACVRDSGNSSSNSSSSSRSNNSGRHNSSRKGNIGSGGRGTGGRSTRSRVSFAGGGGSLRDGDSNARVARGRSGGRRASVSGMESWKGSVSASSGGVRFAQKARGGKESGRGVTSEQAKISDRASEAKRVKGASEIQPISQQQQQRRQHQQSGNMNIHGVGNRVTRLSEEEPRTPTTHKTPDDATLKKATSCPPDNGLNFNAVVVGEKRGGGKTPLHYAAMNGRVDAARVLLRAGAAVGHRANERAESPLFVAARGGHGNVVGLLLEQLRAANGEGDCNEGAGAGMNVNVNSPSFTGDTPLSVAVERGHADVVDQASFVEKNKKAYSRKKSLPFVASRRRRGRAVGTGGGGRLAQTSLFRWYSICRGIQRKERKRTSRVR